MAFEFDENYYLRAYPDVTDAIERGVINSGYAHFQRHGRQEGRFPNPVVDDSPRVFVAGAYGTRNVGDEAIFEGVKKEYPDAIQLYINAPRPLRSVEIYSMARGDNKFRSIDTLIIGGGGLLYDLGAIKTLVELCRRATTAGAVVKILGLGCEAAEEGCHDAIRTLFSFADETSVRSAISHNILKRITGILAPVRDDFAFHLKAGLPSRKRSEKIGVNIGIVTGGDVRIDYFGISSIIKYFSSSKRNFPIRFFHIPHSESHVSIFNNDRMVGLSLYSKIDAFLENRNLNFRLLPFSDDPYSVFDVYARMDGIVSERFHGLVFSHMFGIPALVLEADKLKTRSFVEEHRRDALFLSKGDDDLRSKFDEFVDFIRNNAS